MKKVITDKSTMMPAWAPRYGIPSRLTATYILIEFRIRCRTETSTYI
jgi:hypothetical protein